MNEPPCPFCTIDEQRIFYSGELIHAVWDANPVSPAHALLIPKRHIASWFEATAEERAELSETTTIAREAILKRNASEQRPLPDGFNIGVNVGESAGQTVFHLHVHIIPRYKGDVPDPRGGVRHVLPSRANYFAGIDSPGLVRDGQRLGRGEQPTSVMITGGLDDLLLRPLLQDLDSAHQVDIAVAFVLESGVDLVYAHLREVLERGGAVRLLTGDYMDATDPHALRRLLDLQGDIERRVFESATESFHPKAYIFVQSSGTGVAYVGSSNLTNPALTHGIEWNYRVFSTYNPSGFAEVTRAFGKLFVHPATRPLDEQWIDAYAQRRSAPLSAPIDIELEPLRVAPSPNEVQKAALAALEATRRERASPSAAAIRALPYPRLRQSSRTHR